MWKGLSAVVLLGAMGLTPPVAISEMYHYIDKNGTVSLTNVPTDRRYKAVPFDTYRLPVKVSQQELDQAIAWYSKQHRLSPALLRAVIKAESDFDPRAVSRTGALGLMQLMPRTAAAMKVGDPFNPVENIAGGAKYLRYLLNRFHGDLPLALAAYNAGEYRVKRWQQIPPIQETQFYVKKVLNYYSVFKKGGRIS
jgi:soluble lytic murein transglycosylase